MWKKIKQKKIVLIIIVIIIVLVGIIYQFFIREEKPEFALEKVIRGTVVKEVSETGAVKISEETNLNFKNTGRIEKIYVKVGDLVEAWQALAKLDTSQLSIQLQEAQAAFRVAQAKKTDAQVSLERARQNFKDIEIDAIEDLSQAYQDALTVLDDSYLKIYNAFNVVSNIQRTYFISYDQEGIKVRDNRDKVQNALNEIKAHIDEVKKDSQYSNIDTALPGVKEALEDTKEALKIIRDATETINYRETVSTTDKTSLDNQKSYVSTSLANIVSAQQTISTTKITNETNINTAQAEISKLETQLGEDGLYQSQINQAQANVLLLEAQIRETVLRSPVKGQITKINKREGETVSQADSVISFLASGPFQVEVDIYEEDIVNVEVGNLVEISLAAFPGDILKGRVVSVDPAEKLVGGVVYYEVTIDFETQKQGIRPGMTADIIIESNRKENVLIIPKDALKKINARKIVQVYKDGQTKEREIEIGLEGDELIEVVSGLEAGEEVVLD